ncbi:MAG: GatB/YqeY domain-containing protein [Anaerolineae bacterium]|nr:GatB/YqeY domain-containing protein [Anaerolineae bacterium]
MDDVKAKLQAALKEAMVAKDNQRRDVIRVLTSAVKQVEIDSQKTLSAEDVVAVLQKEAKKRRESIDEATKLGRAEIVEREKQELAILEEFLPRQLSREEIAVIVREVIAQTGVTSAKEMGKLMGALMPRVKGLADGKLVNEVVKELLS